MSKKKEKKKSQNSFDEKLIGLLKEDSRFIDEEGELVKAAIIDRAWKLDYELVKILLSDKRIKDKFFDEIEKCWIFNTNTFIDINLFTGGQLDWSGILQPRSGENEISVYIDPPQFGFPDGFIIEKIGPPFNINWENNNESHRRLPDLKPTDIYLK